MTTVTAVTAFRSAEAVCKTSSRSSRLSRGAGAKPPHHPVGRKCAFDGRQAVKSAFALLSQKVTKARRLRGGKGRRD